MKAAERHFDDDSLDHLLGRNEQKFHTVSCMGLRYFPSLSPILSFSFRTYVFEDITLSPMNWLNRGVGKERGRKVTKEG